MTCSSLLPSVPQAPASSGSFSPRPNLTLEVSLDTQRKWKVRGQATFLFKSLVVLSHSLLLLAFMVTSQIKRSR